MDISSKVDVDAPAKYIFDCLSDFQTFEKAALRRGADVQRVDELDALDVGACWEVSFTFRGKTRDVNVELTEFAAPELACYTASGQGISATMRIELVPMSKNRTRMTNTVNMEAKTLPARLLLQSVKLARGQVEKRLDGMMEDFGRQLAQRHSQLA
ncbi:SRPBCC family protein [Thalassovita sp.]|jgi:carbon monoxide dehydrogenase subunit G|uniref:SRPBCC family protein n=1 Tax=Thalassovita sp. TaxID=1979401 RepID=UPI003B5B37D1